MEIRFISLKLENFKNHKSLEITFDDITNITGRNGVGKSSIGEAITWLIANVDQLGSTKFEPRPIGAADNIETKVELLLQVNNKEFLLGRTQKKTAKYYIDEVPKKATEFTEFIGSLFDKQLFLSEFNPSYFFSQHWQDQRSQLLSYVGEPLNKEVLATMSSLEQKYLEENLKKHSVDDLEKIHRDRFRKNDTALERANERVLTLKEQLEKDTEEKSDVEALQKEIESLKTQRQSLEDDYRIRNESNVTRNRMLAQIESLTEQIKRQQQVVITIKEEKIEETCFNCGQALHEESIQNVKENRQSRYNKEVAVGKELVEKLNKLKTTLPDQVEIERPDTYEIVEKMAELQSRISSAKQSKQLELEVLEAQSNAEKIRNERNDSQSIVDALKVFKTKRSELMVAKVDSLFNKISVRLYEQLKNGEERATFEIEMDGKPYSKLSTAEKIKAGLELIEVLSKKSGVIAPTFVDNAESILNFTKPSGQLIVARVADVDFNIKTVSLKEE